MTDSQAINPSEPVNSCELAMMLDKITAFASRIETLIKREGNINHFSWHAHHDLTSALPHLDALRALVAEQEQASAGEAISRAVDTLDEYANSQVTPAFAVGDTVAWSKSPGREYVLESVGMGSGWWLDKYTYAFTKDLTLIRKANA